eukprot:2563580-Pleurochrysis_carterae.AAC.4
MRIGIITSVSAGSAPIHLGSYHHGRKACSCYSTAYACLAIASRSAHGVHAYTNMQARTRTHAISRYTFMETNSARAGVRAI